MGKPMYTEMPEVVRSVPTPKMLLSMLATEQDSPEPCLMVVYRGLAGSGVALVAYCDGTVLFEDVPDKGAFGHRQERFSSLAEATEILGLPMQLPAGDVSLNMDSSCCCPNYQVMRLQSASSPAGGATSSTKITNGLSSVASGTGSVSITNVRYIFGDDEPVQSATQFRAFRSRIAAHERRIARMTRSLAARLNVGEEAFSCAVAGEGVDNVEERLQLLGLCHRNGADSDEEWPDEVRRATDEILLRLKGGPLTVSALREVLNRRPEGFVEQETADLSGWEGVLEAATTATAPYYPLLRAWLTSRINCSSVVRV